jgi:hypothetical protein
MSTRARLDRMRVDLSVDGRRDAFSAITAKMGCASVLALDGFGIAENSISAYRPFDTRSPLLPCGRIVGSPPTQILFGEQKEIFPVRNLSVL